MQRILVTGAGGFIGHHLVTYLRGQGHWVRGVDLKEPEFTGVDADEFEILDLRDPEQARKASVGVDDVYALAADMGGVGYLSANHAKIIHDNGLINFNTIEGARLNGVKRYLYTSSACVYPEYRQTEADVAGLKEEDVYPAQPQDAYGWEKLMTERLCAYYAADYGLDCRIVRFHNIYGPFGTFDGGREKAPAALCRKVALAEPGDTIEVWGDGQQTRSFCYIEDCTQGMVRLMESGYAEPLNMGRDERVTIDELARMIVEISGKEDISLKHVEGPQGVRGRNSDNSRLREVLDWEPAIDLRTGLEPTYRWIEKQITRA